MVESGIIVVASLNPHKECQDRVRIFGTGGVSPGLRATDYKDPPKILEVEDESKQTDRSNTDVRQ